MKLLAIWIAMAAFLFAWEAEAVEAPMRRVLSCVGRDAKIEVYIQQNQVGGPSIVYERDSTKFAGLYALDLSEAGKGKTLEPIRLQYSKNRKTVVVDQYTRKLPPTPVPVTGGTVDFDQRFATGVKCGVFNKE